MFAPSIVDYLAALENPEGLFRTLFGGLQGPARGHGTDHGLQFERDIYGGLKFRSGNSAAVFRYRSSDGADRFLKLYIRPNLYLREIYDYVERRRPPILPEVRLLADELWVDSPAGFTGWVDVAEGAWTPGETLEKAQEIAVAKGDKPLLVRLATAFDRLWAELQAAPWAHGDLKPENIIVLPEANFLTPDHPDAGPAGGRHPGMDDADGNIRPAVGEMAIGQGSKHLNLRLIDCDAMWIPDFAGRRAAELGTPGFRDPNRTPEHFDGSIDDHAAKIISKNLRDLIL